MKTPEGNFIYFRKVSTKKMPLINNVYPSITGMNYKDI